MATRPIGKLDHIGVAVKNVAEARKFFEGILGASLIDEEDRPERGFKLCHLDLAGTVVELLEPSGQDSFLEKFLDKRGEGLHHLTFNVPDAKAKAAELKASGIRVVEEIEHSPSSFEAFISPRSSHGVLIQLGSGHPTLHAGEFAPPAKRSD